MIAILYGNLRVEIVGAHRWGQLERRSPADSASTWANSSPDPAAA
jgi:hypothetical protein